MIDLFSNLVMKITKGSALFLRYLSKVSRRSFVDTQELLVRGGVKCSSAFADARYAAILLNVGLLSFCRFESLIPQSAKNSHKWLFFYQLTTWDAVRTYVFEMCASEIFVFKT